MERKFTPGPWRIGKNYGCVVSDTNENLNIRGAYEEESQDYYGGYLIGESIEKANAQLISTAPDLLEACIQARSVLVTARADYDNNETAKRVITNKIDILTEVITKALGGNQNG